MVFEKKQLSKALAIALMVACAVAFMPLLNGQAFAAAKKPAKVKGVNAVQVEKTMTAKITWKKAKNAKKYNVKVDGTVVKKKIKAKSYTTADLAVGPHKVQVQGVNGKKKGKWSAAKSFNIVAPLSTVTVAGETKVGQTLTATVAPAGATATYQWERVNATGDITIIKGATAATYVLTAADAGYQMQVVAAGTGDYAGEVTSALTAKVEEATPEALAIVSATQTGAKKITVVFNKEITATDPVITLTRGTTDQKAKATIAADNKTVDLVIENALAKATYKVTATPASGTAVTADVACETEALTEVKFASTDLVLAANSEEGHNYATAVLKGYNQWNEELEFTPDSISAYGVDCDVDNYDKTTGVLWLVKDNTPFAKGDQVEVTVVYANASKTYKETLTVSDAAVASSIEIGDVATDNKDLKDLRMTAERMTDWDYYLPITAKDQYGNTLSADQLNMLVDAGTLFVRPNAYNVVNAAEKFGKNEAGDTVLFIASGYENIYGTGTINILSTGIGTPVSKDVEVLENERIAEIGVTADAVIPGGANEIGITLTNNYGEAVDPYEAFSSDEDGVIEFVDGKWYVDESYVYVDEIAEGEAWLEAYPNIKTKTITFALVLSNDAAGKVVVKAEPFKGKAAAFTFDILAQRAPAKLGAFSGTTHYTTEYDAGQTKVYIDNRNSVDYGWTILDQYGDEIALNNSYRIRINEDEDSPKDATRRSSANGESDRAIVSLQEPGVDNWAIDLQKNEDGEWTTIDTKTLTFVATDPEDLSYSLALVKDHAVEGPIETDTINVANVAPETYKVEDYYGVDLVAKDATGAVVRTETEWSKVAIDAAGMNVNDSGEITFEPENVTAKTALVTALVEYVDDPLALTVTLDKTAPTPTKVVKPEMNDEGKYESVGGVINGFYVNDQFGDYYGATVTVKNHEVNNTGSGEWTVGGVDEGDEFVAEIAATYGDSYKLVDKITCVVVD